LKHLCVGQNQYMFSELFYEPDSVTNTMVSVFKK